jgi:Plasmid pRiA4b ORF-3-like protein
VKKNTDAAAGPVMATKSKRSDTLRSPHDTASIYQLKVTLRGTDPAIWRRLLVPREISLRDLHEVLQVAMGWESYHLYEFKVGKRYYGEPEPKSWALQGFASPTENAGRVRLSDVAPNARATFTYVYDMGDSWSHEVKVEKLVAREPEARYPKCLGGERACPPEDCGGVWGYADLLTALDAPDDPESAELLEWAGPFDPEKFDLDAVNARLAAFGPRGQRRSRRS